MTELERASSSIKRKFKIALFDNNIKQIELARLLDVNPSQLSRALAGNSTPKDIEIQKRAAQKLGIEL